MERENNLKKTQPAIDNTIVDPFTRYLVMDKHIDDPYIPTVYFVEDLFNSQQSTELSKQELESIILYQNFCKILPLFLIDFNGITEQFNKFEMWNDYTSLPILSILTIPPLNKEKTVDVHQLLNILSQPTNDYINYDVETSTVFLELMFQLSQDYVNLVDTHTNNISVIISPYDASAVIYDAVNNLKLLKNGVKNSTDYVECIQNNFKYIDSSTKDMSFIDIMRQQSIHNLSTVTVQTSYCTNGAGNIVEIVLQFGTCKAAKEDDALSIDDIVKRINSMFGWPDINDYDDSHESIYEFIEPFFIKWVEMLKELDNDGILYYDNIYKGGVIY